MKKIFLFLLVLANFNIWAQDIPPVPNPPKLVNDYTKTLTADQVLALENKLKEFDDSTSTNIVVVIISTTDGVDIADYALELGRKWGVGQKGINNGVVLLIAKADRKLNISPGYGLEAALPDVTCKQIIDYTIVPNFKGDDYYRGIEEGTDAIIQAVKGEYTAPKNYGKKSTGSGRYMFIIILIVLFLLFSGGKGGKGGSFMSRRGAMPFILGSLLGSGGSGSSGGGWSGGGGSSGGFGGFGGGSFGGGGASGSW